MKLSTIRPLVLALSGAWLLTGGGAARAVDAPAAQPAPAQPPRVLVFSKTNGYRHGDQIALGHAMLKEMAAKGDFTLDAHSGEDPKAFTDAVLKEVDVVLFLQADETPEAPLFDAAQQAAFEAFIKRGGGFVGTHAACALGYRWPFYQEMVGTLFVSHPAVQTAMLEVVDPKHPATEHLPLRFQHTEEWYNYAPNIHGKPGFTELLRVDEKTYAPGAGAAPAGMGAHHPIAWTHDYAGGRCFYTELGHTGEQYRQGWFRLHLLGGIRWAAGRAK